MIGIGTLVPSPWSRAAQASAPGVAEAPTPPAPAAVPTVLPSVRVGGESIRTVAAALRRRIGPILLASVAAAATWFAAATAFPTVEVVPRYWWGTVAVFAIALVAAMTVVPLMRFGRGRLPESDAGGRVAARWGLPAVTVHADEPTLALDVLDVAARIRTDRHVTVIQLSHPADCDLAVDLASAGRILGDSRVIHELTPGCPVAVVDGDSAGLYTLRTMSLTVTDVTTLAAEPRPSVLVADTARARWRDLARTRELLDAIGCDVRAVIVWNGRIPRDPADRWDPDRI